MFERMIFFNIVFSQFFVALASQMDPKSIFLKAFSKTSICWKSLQDTGCAQKNQGSDLKKSLKNRFNNALSEGIAKNLPDMHFYLHLDLPKPPQNPPKPNWGANK